MDQIEQRYNQVLSMILPGEVFEYFDVKSIDEGDRAYHIYLDEKHRYPEGYQEGSLTSKGFRDEIVIQDFPIRRKDTFLHVRRRKWQVESTGEVISNTFDLAAKGTRYSDEFAVFLKVPSPSIGNEIKRTHTPFTPYLCFGEHKSRNAHGA